MLRINYKTPIYLLTKLTEHFPSNLNSDGSSATE